MDTDFESVHGIVRSTKDYDAWLLAMEPAFSHDLKQKLKVMAGDSGDFLRATFYRWSQRFPEVCEELDSAPMVRAVGDVHVGNFGTWPDGDGRLRWGLNDFDEAGWMPLTNDLTRLATSALLVRNDLGPEAVEVNIVTGYAKQLARGVPGAVDVAADTDLCDAVAAVRVDARKYFEKLKSKDEIDAEDRKSLATLCDRLMEMVPEGHLHHRRAGRGSLGRVRVFAVNKAKPPHATEAKRVLRSAWSWSRRGGTADPEASDDRNRELSELLLDPRRHTDPQTAVELIGDHQWVLRPLSPDRVGIDFGLVGKDLAAGLLDRMGAEVAAIHLLSQERAGLSSYLNDLVPGWLARAAGAMKVDTETDFEDWRIYRKERTKA